MAKITVQGFKFLSQLVADSVNCLYIQYTNTGFSKQPVNSEYTVDYFKQLAATEDFGYARVPLLASPKINEKTGAIEFSGMINDQACRGAALIDGTTGFYNICLVHAQDFDNMQKDLIIGTTDFPSQDGSSKMRIKPAGVDLVFRTTIKLG